MTNFSSATVVVAQSGDSASLSGTAASEILAFDGQVTSSVGAGGNDILLGFAQPDSNFDGGAGDDTVAGGAGDDTNLFGGSGDDVISGGSGNDTGLDGGSGDDIVLGGEGDDELAGGAGADIVYGGFGDDLVDGGFGGDLLIGGPGSDTFLFRLGDSTAADPDVLSDFEAGDRVTLDLSDAFIVLRVDSSLSTFTEGPDVPDFFPGTDVGETGVVAEIVDDVARIFADTNGDGDLDADDFVIEVLGVSSIDLATFTNAGELVGDPSVLFAPTPFEVDEGGSQTLEVNLGSTPRALVSVTLQPPSDLDLGAGFGTDVTLTFLDEDPSPQTLTVFAASDADAIDETALIDVDVVSDDPDYDALTPASFQVTIIDDDAGGPNVTFSENPFALVEQSTDEDGDFFVTVSLTTTPSAPVDVMIAGDALLKLDGQSPGVDATVVLTAGSPSAPLPIFALDDGNFSDDSISLNVTVTSADPAYNGLSIPDLVVDVEDDDTFVSMLTFDADDAGVGGNLKSGITFNFADNSIGDDDIFVGDGTQLIQDTSGSGGYDVTVADASSVFSFEATIPSNGTTDKFQNVFDLDVGTGSNTIRDGTDAGVTINLDLETFEGFDALGFSKAVGGAGADTLLGAGGESDDFQGNGGGDVIDGGSGVLGMDAIWYLAAADSQDGGIDQINSFESGRDLIILGDGASSLEVWGGVARDPGVVTLTKTDMAIADFFSGQLDGDASNGVVIQDDGTSSRIFVDANDGGGVVGDYDPAFDLVIDVIGETGITRSDLKYSSIVLPSAAPRRLFAPSYDADSLFGDATIASLVGPRGVRIEGGAAGDEFGFAVSEGGQLSGSAASDLAVGAPGTKMNEGAVYVFEAKATNDDNPALTTASSVRASQAGPGDRAGAAVAPGGLVSGDGQPDLLVGLPGNNAGVAQFSTAAAPDLTFDGEAIQSFNSTGSQAGTAIVGLGDIKGDVRNDFAVGAPFAVGGDGEVRVALGDLGYFGSGDTLQPGFRIRGAAGDQAGQSLATIQNAGPAAQQGLVIGAPGNNRAYVLFTDATSIDALDLEDAIDDEVLSLDLLDDAGVGYVIEDSSGGSFGTSVANAGDVNDDGFDDLLIGDPTGASSEGVVYLLLGGDVKLSDLDEMDGLIDEIIDLSLLDQNPGLGVRFRLNSPNAALGTGLAGVGDLNGDGLADFTLGAPGAFGDPGAAFIVFGSPNLTAARDIDVTQLSGGTGFAITGSGAGDLFGRAAAPAADFNLDGANDAVIGAPGRGGDTGAAYVLFGRQTPNFAATLGDDVLDLAGDPAVTAGDDTFDALDGGEVLGDTIDASNLPGGVIIDLFAGTADLSAAGRGAANTFSNFDSVIGSPFDDILTATLLFAIGEPIVVGGPGADILNGFGGFGDIFVFEAGDTPAGGFDVINDFESGQDRIDVPMNGFFETVSVVAGAADAIGDVVFGNDFEIQVDDDTGVANLSRVFIDADGDGATNNAFEPGVDIAIDIDLDVGPLGSGDFI